MSIDLEPQRSWYTQDGDTDYLTQVLRHEPMELNLNDRVAFRFVVGSYLRAAFFAEVAGVLGLIIGFIVGGVQGMVVLWLVLSIAVFLIVYLRSKVNEPLGEWKVLLSDRAQSADFAYSKITGVIKRRNLPVAVKARRMINDVRTKTVANRLIVTQDTYTVCVSVFPYGTGLYLSWRMWRRRSGFALLKRFLSDLVNAIFGSTDIVSVMQRTDPPRAMREAIHSACREGLKVAVNATMVPIEFGFPEGWPTIEGYKQDSESPSAPLPSFTQGPDIAPAAPTVPLLALPQPAQELPVQAAQTALPLEAVNQTGWNQQDDGAE
jgi:hypothetical protein